MAKEADVILNVDHGTICKYERVADGYRLIVDRLTKLRATLLTAHQNGQEMQIFFPQ
jgi:hypothetical protein